MSLSRGLRGWPSWIGYAAAAWCLGYAILGILWMTGCLPFPFGEGNDPSAGISILGGARVETAARIITALSGIGAIVALAMARHRGGGQMRPVLIGFGVLAAVGLALLIPDYRVLVLVAYTPILILGAPFGWPPETNLLAVLSWAVINQFICLAGGLLWAGTTLAYWRRGRGACPACGRTDDAGGWTAPIRARRWGRWATGIAVAAPLVYAFTRLVWALGIPLGISEEFLRAGQEIGLWWAGAALASLAVVGALLTLGLHQRWGEVFPRWIPPLGGRRVPPMLAVVPAGLIAAVVTSAGIMFWRLTLRGGFQLGQWTLTIEDSWAALLPELVWPIWGVALAAAALAYHLRRRGRCSVCGRG